MNNIIGRLEKLRRGASNVTDEYLDCSPVNSEMASGGSDIHLQHDSAESSVEGIGRKYVDDFLDTVKMILPAVLN